MLFKQNKKARERAKRMEEFTTDLFQEVSFYFLWKENCVSISCIDDPEKGCEITFSGFV
jgi:hypothetical protein